MPRPVRLLPSPATTTRPSAFYTPASTKSGRFAWAPSSALRIDPRYTPSSTFETFPFPEGLTLDIPAADYAADPRAQAVAAAARELNEKREAWLNPPDLVDRVPEVVAGYPDRLIPKDEAAAEGAKEAHAHQPLQHSPCLARRPPRPPRCRRGRRLRLGCRMAGRHGRRGDPSSPLRAQSGTSWVAPSSIHCGHGACRSAP